MNKTALIVDDDRTERRMVINILRNVADLSFLEAENGKDTLRILNSDVEKKITIIILDLEMPIMGGLETLEALSKQYPDIPVIVLTGTTNMSDVVKAMKLGAADFLSKPIESARLDSCVRNALKISLMSQELLRLKRQTENSFSFSDLIGHNQGLKNCIKIGKKSATSDLPVLLSGETGTGKELFACALHGESKRTGKAFVTVNCGAIPEKLVESILFGHEKGAFTGAINKTSGKFLEANTGTIFLDEIGELPLEAQVKLLRVIQQKEIQPVGSAKAIPVDIRIISATNRDLHEEVKQKRFREDLYFRLNVLHINLPPLRERTEDIPDLSQHFMDKFCATHHVLPKEITAESYKKLKEHTWPGNVRELENVISRTMALNEDKKLEPHHLFFDQISHTQEEIVTNTILPLHKDGSFKTFSELEQEIIGIALKFHQYNITQTARTLGIAKSTLYSKIQAIADKKSA